MPKGQIKKTSRTLLIDLPLEVLEIIFMNLHPYDLRNVMLTCKMLKELLSKNATIWKIVCKNDMTIKNSSDNRKCDLLTMYDKYRISHNWCSGVYRSQVVINHHTNYMPWLMYYNSEALLVSTGSELRSYNSNRKGIPAANYMLWKYDVPKVRRYDVRTNDISRFIVDRLIVCGNRDGCVTVLKFYDIKRRPKLLCHIVDCHGNGTAEVSAVEVIYSEQACVISGSIYSPSLLLLFFNVDDNDDNQENNINVDRQEIQLSDNVGIRCLSLNDTKDKLAVGLNGNSKPLVLDVNARKLIINADSTMNKRQAVRDIRWHNENIVTYVTHSGNLQCVDIRSNEITYNVMDPFQSTLYCVKSDGDRAIVVGTCEYSRCVLFDTRNSAGHTQMFFTQKNLSPIYSLDFDSTKLIAAADSSVACLNFKVNLRTTPMRDYSERFEYIIR
ncbi:hypothetical protein ACJJTC_019584 [Scirpophaga incertulas]